ncbi:MAG: class I SAM-dependent methyltransferase [Desulfobacteraceae bacterium]|nr:class I SAM-dependent methyltransferase [Desulfobacteraceae bacterium]
MKQKEIFLQSEGDAWFERNRQKVANRDYQKDDPMAAAILEISTTASTQNKDLHILEVGCGSGGRLAWLANTLRCKVYGIDPSAKAIEQAVKNDIEAKVGTAEVLPFESSSMDILVFGFCLSLCDQQDLFRIAMEADRVLKPDSWIVIHDFFAPTPIKNEYHHRRGMYSYKMDYRSLFAWHPYYSCYRHQLIHHETKKFTDDAYEWISTSILRKKLSQHE